MPCPWSPAKGHPLAALGGNSPREFPAPAFLPKHSPNISGRSSLEPCLVTKRLQVRLSVECGPSGQTGQTVGVSARRWTPPLHLSESASRPTWRLDVEQTRWSRSFPLPGREGTKNLLPLTRDRGKRTSIPLPLSPWEKEKRFAASTMRIVAASEHGRPPAGTFFQTAAGSRIF
jgi:hypothetical protein